MKFGYKKLYIDGALVDAANQATFEVICPGDESVAAQISWATKEDTQRALVAAKKGFEYWSNISLAERLDWINRLREQLITNGDLLRESIMYEMGKVWEGTAEDLSSITNSLEFYSESIQQREQVSIKDKEGTHRHHIVEQPIGVTVAFLAYNFPLLNLGFKLGPALAAGCSIIIKPSEYSPLSAYIIGELCAEIGFPKGVINILCGPVEEVGIPLCESTIPRLITMIGSTETAQQIMRQSSTTSIKRFSMECGGNAPFIVFEDADIATAVAHGVALKIGNSGQICVAPNRYFIHENCIETFASQMVQAFQNKKIGFGRAAQPDMGPLTNKRSVEKVHQIVQEAIQQGGELLFGGAPIDRPGYYYQPTVIRINDQTASILQEEIFGPVAILIPFATKEEVITLANNTNAGLASYVYSGTEETLDFFVDKLEFGEIHLNGFKYDIYLPHGGIKNSGVGVDCSIYALDDYLIRKRVTKALPVK